MEAIRIPASPSFLDPPLVPDSRPPTPNGHSTCKRPSQSSRTSQSTRPKADGAEKPKQSKSRNGCVTCKKKRLKCDESKPTCQQCHKRKVTCGGYKKDYKWRPCGEDAFATKPEGSPQAARSPTSARTSRHNSGSSVDIQTSSPNISTTHSFSHSIYQPTFSSSILPDTQAPSQAFSSNTSPIIFNTPRFVPNQYPIPPLPAQNGLHTVTSPTVMSRSESFLQPPSTPPSNVSSGQSPRLIDLLLPGTDLNTPPPEYVNQRPQQSTVPYQPGGILFDEDQKTVLAEDDEVEEIVRHDSTENGILPTSSSMPSSNYSTLLPIRQQPVLPPSSAELLSMRYNLATCGILSIKDGPTENPWRTIIWPLAQQSPALYHAVISLTAFHPPKDSETRVEGIRNFRESIKYLLADNALENMRTDVALATTLVLAFSESWDRHVSTGIQHLRGARVLVKNAIVKHKKSPLSAEDIKRFRFLCNTWVYMDVIARLTSIDAEEPNSLDAIITSPSGPFAMNNEIDPLLGCASTLFPLIGGVANLVRRVRQSTSNSINIISQAKELQKKVVDWQPPAYLEVPEDPSSGIQDSLQTAEAYRWATLLYLHQAVPEVPSDSAAKMANKVLAYLATVPLTSRAIIIQIYPLLAAGCEATEQEDRKWIKERWEAMKQRMLIGNIAACWHVVQEVWKRRDEAEEDETSKRYENAGTKWQAACSVSDPKPLKRKYDAEDDVQPNYDLEHRHARVKRRATIDSNGLALGTIHHQRPSDKKSTIITETLPFDRTVRGKLHWIGVMHDWNWEVLLG